MPTPRAFPAVAVLNGQVYVIGGREANGTALEVVERYDPVSDTWSPVDSLSDARFNASATVFNGQILLSGGRDDDDLTDDVEVYNPVDGNWESFDSIQDDREGHSMFSDGTDVFVFGGLNENGQFRSDTEVYNEGTESWDDYPFWVLEPPRAAFAAIPVGQGVLIFGGFGSVGPVAEVELYVPNQPGTLLAPMPAPRGSLAAAKVTNLVFAIGGRNAGGTVVARVDAYLSMTNQWESWPALPDPREGAVAAGIGNDLYVFGGQTDTGVLATTALRITPSTANEPSTADGRFALVQTGPNPFGATTAITLTSETPASVTLAVYDLLGRRVSLLYDGQVSAGRREFIISGSDDAGRPLSSGMYIVRASDGQQTIVRRITLLR